MEIGTILLYIALFLGLGALALSIAHVITKDRRLRDLARYLSFASFTLVTAVFLLLCCYFLASDLHIDYVFSYTDSSYEWYYKLSGVWAGEKGTVLLWTWLISLSLVIEEALQLRKEMREAKKDKRDADEAAPKEPKEAVRTFDWIRMAVMAVITVFLAFLISSELFLATDPMALSFFPEGRGLNPLLKTPYMIVHPVLEFGAYALTAIPLAAALAFLITKDSRWTEVSTHWSRLGWLLYTMAIGIGALWAYNVLGWGGYWAWDPVETANLIPWIALTAFLHSQAYTKNKRMFTHAAPLLAVLVFVFTLFSTFETRSGFVVSVLHAFTGSSAQILDPGAKLVSILQTVPSARFFLTLIIGTLVVAGMLFVWRFWRLRREEGRLEGISGYFPPAYMAFLGVLLAMALVNIETFVSWGLSFSRALGMGNEGAGMGILVLLILGAPLAWILVTSEAREEEGESEGLAGLVNSRNLMTVTVAIFFIWFCTTVLLMLMGVGGLAAATFEDRLPFILIPLLIVLTACLVWKYAGGRTTLYAVAILVLAAVLGYALVPNKVVGLYVAVVVAALVASCYKIVKTALPKTGKLGMMQIGGILLIISGLLGIITWSNPGRLMLLSVSFDPGFAYAVLGFMSSVLALVGGISALGARDSRFGILGAVFGMLSLGHFFAGVVLSAIALALIVSSLPKLRNEPVPTNRPGRVRPLLRSAGAHVIHVGVALLIIGYVASNYLSEQRDFNPGTSSSLTVSAPVQFNDYRIRMDGSDGADSNGDGALENVMVHVTLLRGGTTIGSAVMEMGWELPQNYGDTAHYIVNVHVMPTSLEDVYFIGYAFRTETDGWIQIREDTGKQFTSDDVSEVAFQVKSLPMMGALWGGMATMSVGVAFILFAGKPGKKALQREDGSTGEKKDEKAEAPVSEKEAGEGERAEVEGAVEPEESRGEKPGAQKDYEKMFEDELSRTEEEQ